MQEQSSAKEANCQLNGLTRMALRYATHLLEQGENLRQIQVNLGHRVKGFASRGRPVRFDSSSAMFYVYVLQSESDQGFYIGFSADLRRRLREHNVGDAPATAQRGPWRLIYYEAYLEEADALGRERYLKSGAGRRFLKSQLRHHLAKYPARTQPRPLV